MIRRPPRSTRTEHSFPTRRSSDLVTERHFGFKKHHERNKHNLPAIDADGGPTCLNRNSDRSLGHLLVAKAVARPSCMQHPWHRSEEHTSELQSLMRISYAVFCLKKKRK